MENNVMKEIILFFHGFNSSNETNKFTCIKRNKECTTVDYTNLKSVFEFYDSRVRTLLSEYDKVVLCGHSLGGYFANHFANKYNLKALLINPCVRPAYYIKDYIDVSGFDLSFNTGSTNDIVILAEEDDEVLDLKNDLLFLIGLPNYSVQYFKGGNHRTCREDAINLELDILLDHPIGLF